MLLTSISLALERAKESFGMRVIELLRHKDIANTLIYTQLVEFENDDYSSAITNNVDEAKKIIEAGFEYVCNHKDVMIFRKRK
jgi:hypothetical protein